MILVSTADRNKGFCGLCKREAEHLAHLIEIGNFRQEWENFLSETNNEYFKTEDGKKHFQSFIYSLVDENLKEQLSKPDREDDIPVCFLSTNDAYDEKLIGEYDRNTEFDVYDLMSCKRLSDDWVCPTIRFLCNFSEIPNFPNIAGPFIIFSKVVLDSVEQLIQESVQIIPVKVRAKDGIRSDFYAINILATHDVWDMKISTWKGLEGNDKTPMFCENMMAKDEISVTDNIFRNSQFSPLIVVSKELGALVEKFSPNSVKLESINKWSN